MLVNLKEILQDAHRGKYAVGLFNTTDTDMLEAVISAAEELRAPVIIGTAEILLPAGELKLISPAILAAAKRASRIKRIGKIGHLERFRLIYRWVLV